VQVTLTMRVARALAPVIMQLMRPPPTLSPTPVSLNVRLPKLMLTTPKAQ